MKILKSVEEIGNNLKVILRMDTDLPIEGGQILDNSRLKKSVPTIRLLLERESKIVIVGHRGRPRNNDLKLSLKPVYLELMSLLEANGENTIESIFIDDIKNEEMVKMALDENQIVFVENIRFWEEEDKGDIGIFSVLKKYCNTFVNDALAVAHRKSASVLLHRELNTFYGFDFVEEAEKMEKLLSPERPFTIVLGGAKADKLSYLDDLKGIANYILVGGKLPLIGGDYKVREANNDKVIWANLSEDKLDLNEYDIDRFTEVINVSKTIVWSGSMGFYESDKSRNGTEKIARAIAESDALYKVVAGGDTNASIKNLGLKEKINFVCSGAGVLLEFLSKKTLPAWS